MKVNIHLEIAVPMEIDDKYFIEKPIDSSGATYDIINPNYYSQLDEVIDNLTDSFIGVNNIEWCVLSAIYSEDDGYQID
jgi:hypothetical protein